MLKYKIAPGLKEAIHPMIQQNKGKGVWVTCKLEGKDDTVKPVRMAMRNPGWEKPKTFKKSLKPLLDAGVKPKFLNPPEKMDDKVKAHLEAIAKWDDKCDAKEAGLGSDTEDHPHYELEVEHLGDISKHDDKGKKVGLRSLAKRKFYHSDKEKEPTFSIMEHGVGGKIWFVSHVDDNKIATKLKMKMASIREPLKGELDGIQMSLAASDKGEWEDAGLKIPDDSDDEAEKKTEE